MNTATVAETRPPRLRHSVPRPAFDRALFLDSLNPELRRTLERPVDPTPHGFQANAIQRVRTPKRRTVDREPGR